MSAMLWQKTCQQGRVTLALAWFSGGQTAWQRVKAPAICHRCARVKVSGGECSWRKRQGRMAQEPGACQPGLGRSSPLPLFISLHVYSLSSLQVNGSVTSLRCCRCNLPSFNSSLHLSVSFSSGIVGFRRYFGLSSSLTSLPIILCSIFPPFFLHMKPYITCKLYTFILYKVPCKCFPLVHKTCNLRHNYSTKCHKP